MGKDIARGLAEGVESGVGDALSGIRAAMQDIESEITLQPGARHLATPGGTSVGSIIPGGGGTTKNYFQGPWFIREEADISKLAIELEHLRQGKVRAKGG